jgi:DnaA family protein|tara:strand:- start:2915 stop:3622 length:708 start_codon:yes stop_codon:yes gene_type:complete
MKLKYPSLTQIPFKFDNFKKRDFDSFFQGENKDLLYFLNTMIKTKSNNSIYIWGPQGTGKTHLLQAACKKANEMDWHVTYIPLEQYRDFSIDILDGLGKLDLVCIDDLEFIIDNIEWQQRVTLLFNEIRDNKNSIIISSKISPNNIKIDLDDLKSRLVWGHVFKIKAADDELKIKILKKEANERSFNLNDDVVEFLIRRSNRDLTSLIEILDEIDRSSLAAKRKITVPFVKELIS